MENENTDRPVTRAEMEALLTRFADHIDKRIVDEGRRFAQLETRISELETRIDDLRTELKADIERVETNLLTEFHKWARTHEIRSRSISTAVIGFDERLYLLEDRLAEVERKIRNPPAA